MSHRRSNLANVALGVAVFGLLALGLCCWAAPGFASGSSSGCHEPGADDCSRLPSDPCMPTVAAAATDVPTVDLSNADQVPSTGAFDTARAPTSLDAAPRSVIPVSTPPGGVPSPAVFLLHSSFLL